MRSPATRMTHWFGAMICALALLASASLIGWSTPASAADKATLRLEWRLTGYHTPYWYAKDKGFYKDEGIDLKIRWGDGSGKAAASVAAGNEEFGQSDGMILAAGISRGMPLKAIFSVTQKATWVIVSYKDNPVNKPQDLIGKTMSTIASHRPILQFFFKLNNIPLDKVKLQVVGGRVRNSLFRTKTVHATMGIYDGRTLDFKFLAEAGKVAPVTFLRLNEHGWDTLGQMIMTNDNMIKNNPSLVRRFVKASIRGWKESGKPENIDEAIGIAIKNSPNETQKVPGVRAQFKGSLGTLRTKRTQGKPHGWMAAGDWEKTLEVVKKIKNVKKLLPVSSYYTNDFIPSN